MRDCNALRESSAVLHIEREPTRNPSFSRMAWPLPTGWHCGRVLLFRLEVVMLRLAVWPHYWCGAVALVLIAAGLALARAA